MASRKALVMGTRGPQELASGDTLVGAGGTTISPSGGTAMVANMFYATPRSSTGTSTLDNGSTVFMPLPVPNAITIKSLSIKLSGSTTGHLNLGIYADNGSMQPGNLLGQVALTYSGSAATLTGTCTINLPSAGMYWLACQCDTGMSVTTLSGILMAAFTGYTTLGNAVSNSTVGYTTSDTYSAPGSLPATPSAATFGQGVDTYPLIIAGT